MEGSEVALASIALVGTLSAGFFALVNKQNEIHSRIGAALDRLAEAHETGNRESAERNGHLGEQNIEIAKISKEISKKLDSISTQEVHDQHVHKQVIEKE